MRVTTCCALMLFSCSVLRAQVIYVSASAHGANDGSSWVDAFAHLQDALDVASAGYEVWIAQGVYRPDAGMNQSPGDSRAVFRVPTGVGLIGGFLGNETSVHGRPEETTSTLSGDLAGDDLAGVRPTENEPTRAENSLHLLEAGGPGLVLNRLTFTGAKWLSISATGCTLRSVHIVESQGGFRIRDCDVSGLIAARNASSNELFSLLGNSRLNDSQFVDNRIEGFPSSVLISHPAAGDSVVIARTLFVGNQSRDGGALRSDGSGRTLIASSQFIANTATCGGGAIVTDDTPANRLLIVNAFFHRNEALVDCAGIQGGGAVFAFAAADVEIVNSTFVGNSAAGMGDVIHVNQTSNVSISNSVFYRNGASENADFFRYEGSYIVSHVLTDQPIEGSAADGPVLIDDAAFAGLAGTDGIAGTADDDPRLLPTSPGVSQGNQLFLPADFADLDSDRDKLERIPLDLLGGLRVQGAGLDMGASETDGSVRVESPPSARVGFSVFPNPSSGGDPIYLVGPTCNSLIVIYDATGREVLRTRGRCLSDVMSLDVGRLRGVFGGRIVGSRSGSFTFIRK